MTDAEKLTVLKSDLQMLTNANDGYLEYLIRLAKDLIRTEGITLTENDTECDMAVVEYAAYLFRKRAAQETGMPRFLRLHLNNLLFKQKGAST